MDTVHTAAFYATAALAIAGALLAALGRSRALGAGGLLLTAIGAALLLADLSAGFAGLLTFIILAAGAGVVAATPGGAESVPTRGHNLAALLSAVLFAALVYAAYRGLYHSAQYPGGQFNAGALGRLLVGRDALAVIAVGAATLVAARSLDWGRGGR